LRCADVHSAGCNRELRARRPEDVVELAREHGAVVHGFTAVWYSKQRLATIAAAIGRLVTEPAADDAHGGRHQGRTPQRYGDIEP
jgi:Protein of unknown function (DUF1059)